MNKKVLFTHSYFYPLDEKQWKNKTPYPPLATILAAAVLREMGCEVELFDTNLRNSPHEIENKLNDQPDFLVVYDDGFNYLTKMCLTTMRDAALKMIKMAASRGISVLVSSSDSTDHYQKYLDAGATAVIMGEGEITLQEIVKQWNGSSSVLADINGIAYSLNGFTQVTAPRKANKDLDSLPLPAWDLVDINAYKNIWEQGKYPFHLNIATTRGCPFKCNWCAKPIYGNRYNTRSPEKVLEEIAFLMQTYQVDKFWMCDDIFGLKPGWVKEFNQLVQEKKLKFQYKIQSRADLLVKDKTIEELAKSGLYEVWMGAESGSQKILDAMDKGTTLEQIKTATQKLQNLGVRVAYFIQFGYLGESKKDIELTLNMIETNKPDDIGVSVSYPLPGTPFYDRVKADLQQKANWTDSDDLAMMFQGTFNSNYYKTLHRYLHKSFRWRQAKEMLTGKSQRNASNPIAKRTLLLAPLNAVKAAYFRYQLHRLDNVSRS